MAGEGVVFGVGLPIAPARRVGRPWRPRRGWSSTRGAARGARGQTALCCSVAWRGAAHRRRARVLLQAEAAVALFAYGAAVSYDLYMLSPQPGEDPMETLERLEECEEAAAPDPVIAERNRRIAVALIATNSNYTESEIKFDVIAEQSGISVEEARAKHRYIVLFDEDGLQITLSDEQASINFPYRESLDPKRLAEGIAKASNVIREEQGGSYMTPSLRSSSTPFATPTSSHGPLASASASCSRSRRSRSAKGSPDHRDSLWRRICRRR